MNKRIRIILFPSLSALLFILSLLSLIWTVGSISESSSKLGEYRSQLAVESSATERVKWESLIQGENRMIRRNIVILITVISASAGVITFMLTDSISIYNDPNYIQKRKTEKTMKYTRKLTYLNSDAGPSTPPPAMPPHPSPSPNPIPASAAPSGPVPSGRPIIRSSAAAATAKAAPAPPPVRPTAPPVPAPSAPPPPPPPPTEFPHEFPELEPEEEIPEYTDFYEEPY